MIIRKRFLLLALLLVAVVALSVYSFSKPVNITSSNTTSSNTKFAIVNMDSFNWSGQNEGETIVPESHSSSPYPEPAYPPFSRFSLIRGINEAPKRLGSVPMLPTLLPEGMNYADVYIGPTVDICFSYKATQDPRFADIVIEISRTGYVPSTEQRKNSASTFPGFKLIQVGDTCVVINENAHDWDQGTTYILADFFYNNLHYVFSARPPLTTQDVIIMIESMIPP